MIRALARVAAVLWLAICPAIALAVAAPGTRPESRRVELVVAHPVEELPRFEAALREVLAAKALALASVRKSAITPEDVALATTATADEAASTVARVFVDFATPGRATLFLIDPGRGRIHVRRVMLDHGFDAVARETILFVIQQSIDAILEGRDIGMSREEYQRSVAAPPPSPAPTPAPPPAPAPSAPPPAAPGVGLLLAGGYDGVAMGAGAYQHAAKVLLAARLTRFQLAAFVRVAAPLSIAGDGAQARLWGTGAGVSAAAKLAGAAAFSVSAGLGAGLDLTRIEPAVTTPDLQVAAAFWARSPSLRAFVEAERLFGRLSLAVAVGVDVHPLAERYTVRTGGQTRDVFAPRRVRPEAAALVGVVF